MVDAPRFVQSRKDITLNHLIADKAQVPEQLVVVGFTVGQSLLLVVTMAQKRLLTLGTHKVLHVPVFTHSLHYPLFNRSMTSTADRYPHLVVTR